jgi:hypothetical protein
MDEGHHLTRPHPLYQEQLVNLRKMVKTTRNTVFALYRGGACFWLRYVPCEGLHLL